MASLIIDIDCDNETEDELDDGLKQDNKVKIYENNKSKASIAFSSLSSCGILNEDISVSKDIISDRKHVYSILIPTIGENMPYKRAELLCRRIDELGGHSYLVRTCDDIIIKKTYSHTIIDSGVTKTKFISWLGKKYDSLARYGCFVIPEWIPPKRNINKGKISFPSEIKYLHQDFQEKPSTYEKLDENEIENEKHFNNSKKRNLEILSIESKEFSEPSKNTDKLNTLDGNDYSPPKKLQKQLSIESSSGLNFNDHITKELEAIMKFRENQDGRDKNFRSIAYRKAISILRNLPFKITSISQIQMKKGFGDSILKKIEEILETGELHIRSIMDQDTDLKYIEEIQKVWGIGQTKANEIVRNHGIQGIEDLKKRGIHLLNDIQKKGLEFYDDINKRIDREEVEKIGNIVKHYANIVYGPNVESEICGSYRRGKQNSGDVDILLTNQQFGEDDSCLDLEPLIKKLRDVKFLVCDLVIGTESSSYMGLCKLQDFQNSSKKDNIPSLARRIDIKSYPKSCFPFAILHFTGSDIFNRQLRFYAKKRFGLSLTDKGFNIVSTSQSSSLSIANDIKLILSKKYQSEYDIFDSLKINFIPPNERDQAELSIDNNDEEINTT